MAWRWRQIVACVTTELHDVQHVIQDHSRRRVLIEQEPVDLSIGVAKRDGRRARRRVEYRLAGVARGETDFVVDSRGAWLSEVNVMLSLVNGEEIGVSRHRFGGAKNEEAARLECEMERTHDPALQGRRHIDQNVPTTH